MAWNAATVAGPLAGVSLVEISRAARALPPPAGPPRPADLALDGLARLITDGPDAAAPALRRAGRSSQPETSLWKTNPGRVISRRPPCGTRTRVTPFRPGWSSLPVPLARSSSCLADLAVLALQEARRGGFGAAAALTAEADTAAEATGIRIAPFSQMHIAALRGDQAGFPP